MKRAAGLFVSLLVLLWAFPAHAGHLLSLSVEVSPSVAKVGQQIQVTLTGTIAKDYQCPLFYQLDDEGATATAAGNITSLPHTFAVSFKQPHSPGNIKLWTGPAAGAASLGGNCDALAQGGNYPVYVTAPEGVGKITSLSSSSSKVKVGDLVDFTVAGTGGPCALTFGFAGGGWSGAIPSASPQTLPRTWDKAAFTQPGTSTVTVTSTSSPTCEGGQVTTAVTVEPKVEAAQAKPDLVCSAMAYKDKARTLAIPNGDSATFTGGSPKVWLVVTLKNTGGSDVSNPFQTRVQYKYGAVDVNPGFNITPKVTVGQTPRTVAVREVSVPAGTTTMEVTGNVDSKKEIDESNEANNQCTLTITTKLTAEPPVRRQAPARGPK